MSPRLPDRGDPITGLTFTTPWQAGRRRIRALLDYGEVDEEGGLALAFGRVTNTFISCWPRRVDA
jgi:hypothetical protein